MSDPQSDHTATRCHIRLLGAFYLSRPDGGAIEIRGKRTRGLLAYLLLAQGQTAQRDRLAALFWGDRGDAQARASLRQCLHQLKAALAGVDDKLIVVTRDAISLRPGVFHCDALTLPQDVAGAPWQAAVQRLVDVGTGQLLEDLDLSGEFADWLTQERARLEAALSTTLGTVVERCEAAGDWAAVKALTGAWLQRDPLDEVMAAALIRAELATGEVVAARRAYLAFQVRLQTELGVSPGPLIESAIRAHTAVPAPSLPAPAAAAIAPAPLLTLEPAPMRPDSEIVLAVLAFDNLSPDPELGFFCDGVSEEIQCTVARGSDLKVVSRASSFQLRGREHTVPHVAATLGATHLLYGSVRRSGQEVRISAELVEGATGSAIWADRFDGNLADVFALQEKVAGQVAHALRVALVSRPTSPALDARHYEIFLRARGLLAGSDPQYDDGANEAEPLLAEVTTVAPGHAPAWEQLAIARAWMLRYGRNHRPFAEARAEVINAAERALELDPRRAGALLALTVVEPWGAYARREQMLMQALEMAPRDPAVLGDIAQFRMNVGHFNEALAYAERACELNPLMPAVRLDVAQILNYIGNYDSATAVYLELWRRWPENPGVFLSLLNSCAYNHRWEIIDEVKDGIDRFDGWQAADMRASLAFADAMRTRDPVKVERRMARYAQLLERSGTLSLNLVASVGMMGKVEEAFDLAEQATYDYVFDRDGPRASTYFAPAIIGRRSALLQSPRIVPLCARLGLCDYWLSSGHWPDCVAWTPYDFRAEVARVTAHEHPHAPLHIVSSQTL